MLKSGRSCIAAFMACAVLVAVAAPASSSNNTEAGRKYAIACQRLSELRKSAKKKKYRSYWIECIRTFESVEKKYPHSPSAGDACFDRAGIYQDLFLYNKYSLDLNSSIQLNNKCQATYPGHVRAPEALYHIVDLAYGYKKDSALAEATFDKLAKAYPNSPWTEKARTRLKPALRRQKKLNRETALRPMPMPVISDSPEVKSDGMVKSVRFWSGGAYTRIVIDEDKPILFQAQELKNPDRLVFDILNSRVADSINKDPLTVNDGILKQVRTSQHAPDVVRVVLDLASIKSYVAFPLHDPERLVIDVTGEGGKGSGNTVASASTDSQPKFVPKPEPQIVMPPPPVTKTPETAGSDGGKLSLSRQLGLQIKTIAIDAGHGGYDPGAIGKGGLKEKNVTLDIAKRLAVLVKERLGCNVVMTRDRDVFIPLEERPFIAKSKGADLFVSIHINSNRKRRARGIETYVQGIRASDTDAMATAARENAMSTKRLSELKSELEKILKDLAGENKNEESAQLASSVQGSLVNNLRLINRHATDLKSRVKQAFFYVLINTEMPSILAEVGFISNPDEERLLGTESYRQSIAEALFKGIKKYVNARSVQMTGI